MTHYVPEKISTSKDSLENAESENGPSILYGHGEFNLKEQLIESSHNGFNGHFHAKFRACCWNGSSFNLTDPYINLRRVSKPDKIINLVKRHNDDLSMSH